MLGGGVGAGVVGVGVGVGVAGVVGAGAGCWQLTTSITDNSTTRITVYRMTNLLNFDSLLIGGGIISPEPELGKELVNLRLHIGELIKLIQILLISQLLHASVNLKRSF